MAEQAHTLARPRATEDLAAIVNACGVAERAAERAQVGHHAMAPEAGVEGATGCIRQASHFAAIVDGSPEARRTAREGSEVDDATVAEDDGAREPGEVGSSDSLAMVVDAGGEAGRPTECAKVNPDPILELRSVIRARPA